MKRSAVQKADPQIETGAIFARPASRYATLAQALFVEIQSGHYNVGSQLPTESELQERFDVSRHTVRQALRELKERGVISSHPGIGTVVRSQSSVPNLVHGAGTIEDLLQVTRQTRMKILDSKNVIADRALAEFMPCGPGQQWMKLTMLRYLPNYKIPIAHLITYIRPEFSSIVPKVERADLPIFRLIEQHHGQKLHEIKQEITAVTLGREEAKMVEARAGFHALQVLRRFYNDQGRLTQVTTAKYPAGRFTHTAGFRIRSGTAESR